MRIFNEINEIENIEPTVIALGNFDGIHKGHQKLIERTVSHGNRLGLKSAVFTFSNHPKNLLNGRNVIKNILDPKDKIDIIESFGIDYLFNIPFDDEMRTMDPTDFVNYLLLSVFKMESVFCGFNYHYGKDGKGNSEGLIELSEKEGFEINVLEPYIVDGELVSSSLIRKCIADGKVDECYKYMGRYYYTKGEVIVGNKIGRKIGFPTCNIVIDDSMVWPAHGVYVTNCYYNDKRYPGVTNVGYRPTIGDNKKVVETHMLNFEDELYGKNIRVEFLEKIRDEKEFSGVEELAARIDKDKKIAEEYHNKK